jgi:hypothetical protein
MVEVIIDHCDQPLPVSRRHLAEVKQCFER